jgi:6-phosphofructokinase
MRPVGPKGAKRRICAVTCGGDAPGVNAILRGFCHAARRLEIETLGCRYGFEGLLDSSGIVELELVDVRGILHMGGSVLGCSTRVNPFFVPGPDGPPRDMSKSIVDRLRSIGVDALVMIGGDGTMVAAQRFISLGLPCIGVPKTIDNDLGDTDTTCGFDTAVETATRAIDALHATAEAHSRVLLVEVMGRNAGYIALHAGVAGGADVILMPELPYSIERVVAKIREREALGRRFSIIVVAEGTCPVGGCVLEVESGRPGHLPRLGGAGARLMADLNALNLGHDVRLMVLGLLQRGGSPCAFDRILGTEMGTFAAELCAKGRYGRMIAMRDGIVRDIPLTSDKYLHKEVGRDHPLLRAAKLVGIELGAD